MYCLLLFIHTAFAKQPLQKLTLPFDGKSRTYYCYIPDDPRPLPVVVLLHGSGRDGHQMADPWKSLAASEHFIIAAPDSYDPAAWDSDKDPPEFLHAVVDQVKALHPIDENRIYLFGHSGGAVYALAIALIDSEYYAATAVHAGALRPQNYSLFARAKRHMPIAIWVGDHDGFFPIDSVRATETAFKSHGFDLKLTVMMNRSHSYEEVAEDVNRQAWKSFSAASLQPNQP
jgi:poly(3-hydroxybutyrate) depolymerase